MAKKPVTLAEYQKIMREMERARIGKAEAGTSKLMMGHKPADPKRMIPSKGPVKFDLPGLEPKPRSTAVSRALANIGKAGKVAGKLSLPLMVAGVAAEAYSGYKSGGIKGAALAGLKSAISPATDALAATPAGEVKKVRTLAPHVQLKALDRVNAVKNFAGNQGMRKLSSAYAKSKAAASATGKQDKANRAGSAVLVKGHYAVSDTGKSYFVKQHMRQIR